MRFSIDASQIKDQPGTVMIAPWGTESEPLPCLVWLDPNPGAMIPHSIITNQKGKVVTARSERGLIAAGKRLGLRFPQLPNYYVP
ncbi:hypothetical protein [Aquabacterium sp. OR-4]|uniref:hypothetical protein n=1 Tax=Aquabacterium sp. OR-4 TaxID=2978127 RepID=UPI0021B32495|nr:hypothetical protein [Aquabacterium sp. OR-4]MDT7834123.1 hypothetical protein [Aquabacterium sp. OR-4]